MDDSAIPTVPALARRHGRELAALAYAVLQNRAAAEQSAAQGVADALRPADDGASLDDEGFRHALIAATLRRALESHARTREVDAVAAFGAHASLSALAPLQRAVAAGHLAGGVPLDPLAAGLGLPPRRVRTELAEAEAIAGGRAALAHRLREHQAGRPFRVAPEAVEAAIALPPAVRRAPRWPLVAMPAAAAALLAAAVVAGTAPTRPAATSPSGTAGPRQAGAAVAAPFSITGRPDLLTRQPPLPLDERLSLADCDIQPAGSELAFRGWLTLGDLSAAASGSPAAGTPIYALVTAGTAEWVGWQTTEGRPMFPRPVGRMACAVDPITAGATVFAVSERWQPPPAMDGCPASPITLHAGDRQVGGPSAFVLLPGDGMAWWADDPSLRILVRIAPTPSPNARITAAARSLDGRSTMALEVDSPEISPGRPPTSDHYWLRDVRFPVDGCWLVSVSVDGAPVGAAILPVSRRPG